MLLENFDSTYLNNVITKIQNYSLQYDEFFQKSIEKTERVAKTSIQARTIQGLSIAGKFVGEQISKIPDKSNRIKIDDSFLSGSEKLNERNLQAIRKTVDSFTTVEDSDITLFEDKIRLIDKMDNESMSVLLDSNTIYIPKCG